MSGQLGDFTHHAYPVALLADAMAVRGVAGGELEKKFTKLTPQYAVPPNAACTNWEMVEVQ